MVILNEMKHVSPAGLGTQQLINTHAGKVALFSFLWDLFFFVLCCFITITEVSSLLLL